MDQPPRKLRPLSILIYICFSILFSYIGFTIASCSLMIPGTIQYEYIQGKLKNPPPINCNKSQGEGINQLLTAIGLLIAYKAKSDD